MIIYISQLLIYYYVDPKRWLGPAHHPDMPGPILFFSSFLFNLKKFSINSKFKSNWQSFMGYLMKKLVRDNFCSSNCIISAHDKIFQHLKLIVNIWQKKNAYIYEQNKRLKFKVPWLYSSGGPSLHTPLLLDMDTPSWWQ